MPWGGGLPGRFAAADRLLLHWQQVGALGRPGHAWQPLDGSPGSYPEMLRRIALAEEHGTFRGTEQMGELRALAAELQPPPAPAAAETAPELPEEAPEVIAVLPDADPAPLVVTHPTAADALRVEGLVPPADVLEETDD